MRIERISETQIKFVLMTDDLAARDIKISELSYASDKTQQLFREITHLVQDEDDFVAENTPLMFEAMRVGVDSLVVVVTKIGDSFTGADGEKKFNLIPTARQECRFKRVNAPQKPSIRNEDSYSVFSFEDLDIMAAGAMRLNFAGQSQVYKLEGRYYLLLSNETQDNRTTGEMEAILFEYGQKHVSNVISRQYLHERGEVVITGDAVDKLRAYQSAATY